MLKQVLITLLVCLLVFELVEHVLVPLVALALGRRRKRLALGQGGLVGRIAVVTRWGGGGGQVRVGGEIWRAVCEVPLPVGSEAIVRSVEGLTLTVAPRSGEDAAVPESPR